MKNKIPYDGPNGFSLKGYYKSDNWFKKSRALKYLSDYRCYRCGSRRKSRVHHKTYKNIPNELPEDLVVLCKWCHETVHKFGIIDITPLPEAFNPINNSPKSLDYLISMDKEDGLDIPQEQMDLYEELCDEMDQWMEYFFGDPEKPAEGEY